MYIWKLYIYMCGQRLGAAALSSTGQERYREGGSCSGTAWLQMGGVPVAPHPEFHQNWLKGESSGNPDCLILNL